MSETSIKTPETKKVAWWKKLFERREFWTLMALAIIFAVNSFNSPLFFSIRNVEGRYLGSLIDIINRGAPIMLLAIGMTLVIATKGIDLSVGSTLAISGAIAAVMIHDYPLPVVLLASLGVAVLCGLWNGLLVAVFDIQPIIATLILMVVGRGIAQMITGGQIAVFNDPALIFIGSGVLFGIPFPIFIALAVLLLVYLLTRKTALGLLIESVGANDRASYYAGINATSIKLAVYMVSGLCAGIAGLIYAGNIKGADANNVGLWSELDAILAVVIGGTALTGGRFHLFQSVVGVLIIQSMHTGILISGWRPELNHVVKAVVILFILLMQSPEFRQMISGVFRRERKATV
jgi:ribose/xylose/arabinose/galactoside ABC-type transport system permease subunit